MASTKISNLPSQTGVSQTDIVAIVDVSVPQTNKITKENLFRALNGAVSAQSVSNGSSDLIGTDGSEIRNNSYTSVVAASQGSYIDDGQNHFIGGTFNSSIQSGAAGHSGIVGCDGVSITGGYNHFIGGSYSGPQILGGEENVILASVGGTQVQGQRNAAVATQGVQISSEKNAGIASEGLSISNTRSSAAVASYGGNLKGGYYNFRLGSFGASVNDGYNSNENVGDIGGRDNTLIHDRSTMISASGKTTQYSATTHVENLYAFSRIQSETYSSTTISNEQFLIGGLGMVQYTEVNAGNLNLKINDVRNGEVYYWAIDNKSGGSISLNSIATNTGFSVVDDTGGGSLQAGTHLFVVVIVNDIVIVSHHH